VNEPIVITGATCGIGRALVDEFVRRGSLVCGAGRNPEALDELRSIHPSPHDFVAVDVTAPEAVARWADHVVQRHGAPRLLVHCAGVIHRPAPVWQLDPADIARVVDTNLTGTLLGIRAFAPAMIAAGRGTIINFSSEWGHIAAPMVATYCATKWAIEGLTRSVALELPSTVSVVAVSPGLVDTAMLRTCLPGLDAPSPAAWAAAAASWLLALGPEHSGRCLTFELLSEGPQHT
jgi:NAD(P)-dependent dehydrogenase (short-subunit alcohol dehydrogenase family)